MTRMQPRAPAGIVAATFGVVLSEMNISRGARVTS
jgi:hypothetical protein